MVDTTDTERQHRQRFDAAQVIVAAAARLALARFRDLDSLRIDVKGLQDWVSDADREVELAMRRALAERFPNDGIVGEEDAPVDGDSGYTWVIDPIDGTTSFISGTPGWCSVLACVDRSGVVLGVVCDPVADEIFDARRGAGARVNGQPITVSAATSFSQGSLAVGHNTRIAPEQTLSLLTALLGADGMFYSCGSGALMLCYVAAGRLIGYAEPHMNGWDCLAALCVIEEAGGEVLPFEIDEMVAHGGRVVTAGPALYPKLRDLAVQAYAQH